MHDANDRFRNAEEERMISRLLGALTGGIVTFLLLWLFDNGRIVSSEKTGWLIAIAIGLVANALWPFFWGIYFGRKARNRRDEQIQSEVQRQLDAERNNPA
jgi:hypothetical protein